MKHLKGSFNCFYPILINYQAHLIQYYAYQIEIDWSIGVRNGVSQNGQIVKVRARYNCILSNEFKGTNLEKVIDLCNKEQQS